MMRLNTHELHARIRTGLVLCAMSVLACSETTGNPGSVDAAIAKGDAVFLAQDSDTTGLTSDSATGQQDTPSWGPETTEAETTLGGQDSEDTEEAGPTDRDLVEGPCAGMVDGSVCDDGDLCTVDDSCQAGLCVGGSTLVCEVEEACRVGSCDPAQGCVYEDASDGTTCAAACFEVASCQTGSCVGDPETAVVCPESDMPCVTQMRCEIATGECTEAAYADAGTACDLDENLCTLDACDGAGSCVASASVEDCAAEKLDQPCWLWTCSAENGCVQAAFMEGASCDDNDACSVNDTCVVGPLAQELCLGSPIPIDDSNVCTDDACLQGVVSHEPIDGAVCESECGPGLCDGGACVPTDECGCNQDADCADIGDVCTGQGVCKDGECEIDPDTALVCPEVDHPCAVSVCDVALGLCALAPAPVGTTCDDEIACVTDGLCTGTLCTGGLAPDCNDEDPCTVDSCEPGLGCMHQLSSAAECVEDMTGLAAWYRFEETTGEVLDSSGNGHHGVALGAGLTRGVEGALGRSIEFSASDGRVQVPAHPDLDFSEGATLEAWVWLATTGGVGSVMTRGTGNGDQCVLMNSSQGNMQTIFQTTGGTTNVTSPSGAIPVMTWTHVAVTNDGTTLSLYFDGVFNKSAPGGFMAPLTSDLFIGQREQMIFAFDGRIDEVKWWTLARSPQALCQAAGGAWDGTSCTQ